MNYSPWPINTIHLSEGFFSVRNKQKIVLSSPEEEEGDGFRSRPKKREFLNVLLLEKFTNAELTIFYNYAPSTLFKLEKETSIYCIQRHIKSNEENMMKEEFDFCFQFLLSILYHEEILDNYIDKENGEEETCDKIFADFNNTGRLSQETRDLLLEIIKKNDCPFDEPYRWKDNIFGAFQVVSPNAFFGHSQIKFLPTGEIICQDAGFEVFAKLIVEEYSRVFSLTKIQQCTSFYDLFIL